MLRLCVTTVWRCYMYCVLHLQQVAALISEMQLHLSDGRRGEIVRNGVRVAIAGMRTYIYQLHMCVHLQRPQLQTLMKNESSFRC
jgi:hypothetical protein